MNKFLAAFAGIALGLPLLGWLGLSIKPASFPAYPERTPTLETTTLPARFRFTYEAGKGYRHYIEATMRRRSPAFQSSQ